MRAVRGLSALARGLVGALLPAQCAGCRAWDEVLCQSCRCLVGGPARLASLDGARGPIPLAAVGDYSGPLRRIVLTAKHSSRTEVTDVLHEAGAVLGTALAQVLGVAASPAAALGSPGGRASSEGRSVDVWVVPAPSSWKRRLRGRQVALPLARAAARALAASARPGVRVRVVDAVRLRVGASSQSGKVGAQRTVGRIGSMRALAVPGHGALVVAVDDVVTTGATIREMERVLGRIDAVAAICRPGLIA